MLILLVSVTMIDDVRGALKEILDAERLAVCQEPARCEALLRKRCGDRKEIYWVIGALRMSIVPELLAILTGESIESRIHRLSNRISSDAT